MLTSIKKYNWFAVLLLQSSGIFHLYDYLICNYLWCYSLFSYPLFPTISPGPLCSDLSQPRGLHAARRAPPSTGFPRQGRWAGLPCPFSYHQPWPAVLWSFTAPWTACSLPGSSVHRISQARALGWAAMPFLRGSSPPTSPALQADSLPLSHLGSPSPGLASRTLNRCSDSDHPGLVQASARKHSSSTVDYAAWNVMWTRCGSIPISFHLVFLSLCIW